MKKLATALTLAAVVVLATPRSARADEKVLGTITKIKMATGDTALAVLQDGTSGKTVEITVTDKVTLDKFKDRRIVEGDEIKAKYEKKDGKNLATFFKKPGGCS